MLDELGSGREGVVAWIRVIKPSIKIPMTPPGVERIVGEIMSRYPEIVSADARRGADPWVIAVAEHGRLTVVTEERGGGRRARIPDVCAARGVPCTNAIGMLRGLNTRVGG